MTITSIHHKILAAAGGLAVTVAAPAALFLSIATAHADGGVCTPYDDGYSAGVFGGVGQCFNDPTKQSQFDSGFSDGQAGRPANPPSPFQLPATISPQFPVGPPQSTMSPWDPSQGSWPEPPEFPEYHEPGEQYEPPEEPWERIEPPVID
jgi:hypothetical protein